MSNRIDRGQKAIPLLSSIESPLVSPVMTNETNSSTPKTKRTRSRKINTSRKIVRGPIKNEPYTIPYSTRSQTQIQQQLRQQVSLTEPTTSTDTVNVIQPQAPITERRKYCSKCKESANVVKMINSKMDRIEELVRDLKKVTNEFSHGIKNNSLSSPQSLSSFGGTDFSKMSIGDLQNFVVLITNAIMTTSSNTTEAINAVKLEFDESQLPRNLKLETNDERVLNS